MPFKNIARFNTTLSSWLHPLDFLCPQSNSKPPFYWFRFYKLLFFNWDSLHASLNSHYKAWSYIKKIHKKIKVYRKSILEKATVKRCLLILDLKPFRL